MALERDDGLEFPVWLLALPAAGAVALSKPAKALPPWTEPPPQTAQPLPVDTQQTLSVPGPTSTPTPQQATLQPPQGGSGAAAVAVAVREAARASAVSQATQKVSASIEAAVRKQVSNRATPQQVQQAAKVAAKAATSASPVSPANVARETARIEKKLLGEVDKLRRAGVSNTHIEAIAKGKASALKRQAERAVSKATAPITKALDKVPAPLRREAERAVAPLKKSLEREASKALTPLRRQATNAARDVAKDVGRELGLDQAKQLANDIRNKIKLPNIPVTLPTKLTPDGIKDAVYSSGKKHVEQAMQSAIGISIPLPSKLSVKEIERTLTGLLPKDAKEALEKGLDLGAQIGASALSSAIAGATIGSAIPGLGTVIGIGVALGVNVLKNALKDAFKETHAYQQRCKSEDKFKVKLPELSPIELLPWIAQKRFAMSKALAEEEQRTKCGLAPYNLGLRKLGQECFEIVKSTVPVLGLSQLDKLIPLYAKAPKQEWLYDKGQVQKGGAVTGGSRKVILAVSATGRDLTDVLVRMNVRKMVLLHLVQRAERVEKLPVSELAKLRWDIVTEIGHAALEYQLTGSNEAKRWLGQLGGFMQRLEKREAAAVGAMKQQYEKDLKREAELKRLGQATKVTGII